MVGTYLTPGVYVEELPGGARAIEGVSTSNTLFLGYTLRGPVEPADPGEPADLAVRISSWSQYVQEFGGVVDGNSVGINDLRNADDAPQDVDLMGHAVFAYFQNGGTIAYVRRMVAEVPGAAAGDPPLVPLTVASGSVMQPAALTFEAVNPGTWADGLTVRIDDDPFNAGRFVVTIGRIDDLGRLIPLERFVDVAADAADDGYVRDVLAEGSGLVRVAVAAPDGGVASHRSADLTAAEAAAIDLSAVADPADRTISVRLDPGGVGLSRAVLPQQAFASLEAIAEAVEAGLRASTDPADLDEHVRAGVEVEVIRDGGVFMEVRGGVGPANVNGIVLVQDSGLGGTLLFDPADDPSTLRGSESTARTVTLARGANGAYADAAAHTAALELLQLNDDVNVLVTPNAANDADGSAIVDAVRAHCERMGDRVQIIDPPVTTELDDPADVTGLGMSTSTYTQTYYPWVRVANPVHHPDLRPDAPRTVLVPPSGFAAGMWSRIDARRGVWKAPAGVETSLTGVVGFEYVVGDAAQQLLNPNGINVLRDRRGYGPVIWGARTLATRANPEWRYIPVRRTAIMIEKALRNGIQWAVFEPNSHLLWSSLRLAAESYMDGLFRAGAFQGAKASDAYDVACGLGSTMTQGDIDRGYAILRVAFAPVKPAEFVVIQIQQLVGQS